MEHRPFKRRGLESRSGAGRLESVRSVTLSRSVGWMYVMWFDAGFATWWALALHVAVVVVVV